MESGAFEARMLSHPKSHNESDREIREFLRNIPCFSSMGPITKDHILRKASTRKYVDKENVFMQGDRAEFLYVVLCGYVRLSYIFEDGTQAFLGVLQPGECMGELGVCECGHYAETATAIGDVTLARIGAQVFDVCFSDPATKNRGLAGLLARRYRNYLQVTCDLSLASLAQRLSRVLLNLVSGLGETMTIDGREVPYLTPLITQSDLGAMARGTRTNVNRTLKEWERSGWILLRDRRVVLLDTAKLQSIAYTGSQGEPH